MDAVEDELREETGKNNLPGTMLAAANLDGMSISPISMKRPPLMSTSLDKEFTHVPQANRLSGTFKYESYFGKASLKPDAKPVSGATAFCIASATKLATSVAAMQCVERGLIELDDDVTTVLPELKDIQIFTGIEDGKPVMKEAQNTITLRYDAVSQQIQTLNNYI
jgi:CubicO group peptidase (beta-lactamase class C family)